MLFTNSTDWDQLRVQEVRAFIYIGYWCIGCAAKINGRFGIQWKPKIKKKNSNSNWTTMKNSEWLPHCDTDKLLQTGSHHNKFNYNNKVWITAWLPHFHQFWEIGIWSGVLKHTGELRHISGIFSMTICCWRKNCW